MYTISYPSGTIRKEGIEVLSGPDMDAYVDWLRAGNGPTPLQDPVLPRQITVSAYQLRKALNRLGLRDQVEAAVSSSADREIQDGWEYAAEFQSDHVFVIAMAASLGMSSEEMRSLFELAESL